MTTNAAPCKSGANLALHAAAPRVLTRPTVGRMCYTSRARRPRVRCARGIAHAALRSTLSRLVAELSVRDPPTGTRSLEGSSGPHMRYHGARREFRDGFLTDGLGYSGNGNSPPGCAGGPSSRFVGLLGGHTCTSVYAKICQITRSARLDALRRPLRPALLRLIWHLRASLSLCSYAA
jgi:hypothetical protein